jgi:hypothetical protein
LHELGEYTLPKFLEALAAEIKFAKLGFYVITILGSVSVLTKIQNIA